ncbi:hypothetical protein CGCA056_v009163 [Colletotrichum aenigma]|uniref:uncharacterized protein n=1 Tax=Colletotrichum aenigma TaxID=1215731 RepID=UPI0018723B74|nr:uncharacterized protein CGCA056_v009163 [Colletotrichum aenigma]KAF5519084.1 hypothetical protein CGCA056_v009163 [Colletotrichum aenigma]
MTSISRSEAMRRGWETRRRNKAERLALEAQRRTSPNASPAAAASFDDVSCFNLQAGISLSHQDSSLPWPDLAVCKSQSGSSPRRMTPPGPHKKLQTMRFPPRVDIVDGVELNVRYADKSTAWKSEYDISWLAHSKVLDFWKRFPGGRNEAVLAFNGGWIHCPRVMAIIGHRKLSGLSLQFKVIWQGLSLERVSWQSESGIGSVCKPGTIEGYWRAAAVEPPGQALAQNAYLPATHVTIEEVWPWASASYIKEGGLGSAAT